MYVQEAERERREETLRRELAQALEKVERLADQQHKDRMTYQPGIFGRAVARSPSVNVPGCSPGMIGQGPGVWNDLFRDVSSYVTYVRGMSVGLLGKFSDVDVRTANRLPGYLV